MVMEYMGNPPNRRRFALFLWESEIKVDVRIDLLSAQGKAQAQLWGKPSPPICQMGIYEKGCDVKPPVVRFMHLAVLPVFEVHRMLEESGRGSAQSLSWTLYVMPF